MRIFYMGREINGRFSSFKVKVKRVLKTTIWVAALMVMGGVLGIVTFGKSTTIFAENIVEVDVTPQKIESLKEDVVTRLQKCESAGHSEEDGIIVFDSNNKASIGQLQFQKNTVMHYFKTLYGKDISSKEAVLIALDTEQARKLAKDIIFTTDNMVSDWLNCDKKLGLTPEVKLIKKLEK